MYLAVSILTPVEHILGWHFKWQNNMSWLASSMKDVPTVVMANMSRSPASHAMHHIIGYLFARDIDMDESSDLLQCFLGLPQGKCVARLKSVGSN